jgi:putative drug exporter of the RND superfamily
MRKLARFCISHRGLVVAGWIVVLLAVTAISRVTGNAYSNSSFNLPGTGSQQAQNLLQAASPRLAGDTEEVVFTTRDGTPVSDPQVRARVTAMLGRLARVPGVSSVVSPYSPDGAGQVSKDGTIAFATVTFDRPSADIPDAVARQLVGTAKSADGPDTVVAVAGQAAEQTDPQDLGNVGIGIGVAAVVLLIVFGSLLAMILPLVSALLALGTGVGLIAVVSHAVAIAPNIVAFVLLVGLGVGVDYALFVVTRYRRELLAGKDAGAAIITAVATSGRTVLFAGITVCVAILGMFALGMMFFYGLAVATALGVALTMTAALTLLPAMLSFLGPRVLPRRQRARLARGQHAPAPRRGGAWGRWTALVSRSPAAAAAVALGVVVLLGVPFLSLRLAFSDQGNDPPGTTTRQAYDLLAEGFGAGFNGPLEVVAQVRGQRERAAFTRLEAAIARHPGVAAEAPAQFTGRAGLAAAGPVFTSAAVIMIFVYASFILGGQRVIKEFGLGLAFGVLIDALIIRTTAVPALMLLLGKASWWHPRDGTAAGQRTRQPAHAFLSGSPASGPGES